MYGFNHSPIAPTAPEVEDGVIASKLLSLQVAPIDDSPDVLALQMKRRKTGGKSAGNKDMKIMEKIDVIMTMEEKIAKYAEVKVTCIYIL